MAIETVASANGSPAILAKLNFFPPPEYVSRLDASIFCSDGESIELYGGIRIERRCAGGQAADVLPITLSGRSASPMSS